MAGSWFQRLKGTDHISEGELLQLVLRYLHSRGHDDAVKALAPVGVLKPSSLDDKVVSLDALCWEVLF